MPRRTTAALLAAALAGCAPFGGPAPAAGPPRLRVETFGGFPASREPVPPGRVALVVDATRSMAEPGGKGTSRVRAARAAAERFAQALPSGADLGLFVLGGDASARCDGLPARHDGDRDDLVERIGALRARGDGSLAAMLDRFDAPSAGGFERVVAFTALADDCGGDVCRAVKDLAARGVRLDLVLIGGVEAPACVADVTARLDDAVPEPWQRAAPIAFHVESVDDDPAVIVCGEAGGLPVQLPAGPAAVVVKLDPPLRVERDFAAGTRWVLQVLDFPGLDPPERQWRWLAGTPPVAVEEMPAVAVERKTPAARAEGPPAAAEATP